MVGFEAIRQKQVDSWSVIEEVECNELYFRRIHKRKRSRIEV